MNRKAIAQETVAVLQRGEYGAPTGKTVSIAEVLRQCVAGTTCHLPEALGELREEALARAPRFAETRFVVANETTLRAAERLVGSGSSGRVGVLNFASARNPGGGFLGGAQAQEESLARSSGLYKSLCQCPEHYQYHKDNRSGLYSDRVIYSPDCPVFRRDNGTFLEDPYSVDFITSPAPNAGAIRRNDPEKLGQIASVLEVRGAKLLGLAAAKECDRLILGAWGCGVFRNNPTLVAEMFAAHLTPGGPFWARFHTVAFAVLDHSPEQTIITPFRERFTSCQAASDAAQ